MRLTAVALFACSLALVACSSSVTPGPDAGPGECKTAQDCPQTPPQVCVDATSAAGGRCVPSCNTSNDCTNDQVCEDAICVNPGCGGNGGCSGAQVCQSGKCVAPAGASTIASCFITPNPAVVKVLGKVALTVFVKDNDGQIVQAAPAWSGDSNASVESSGLVTGTTAGVATITATVGAAKTCSANVKVYAGTSTGIHAVVIDAHTKRPLAGVKVLLDHDANVAANLATTDADGSVTFASATGTHDVHAFATEYNYTSYIGVTAGNDLLIALSPYVPLARRSAFKTTLTAADFAALNQKGATLHVALMGSSIPNSILDFSLDTLLGAVRQVTINLGGSRNANLSSNMVIGVAADLFGTGDLTLYAEPGKRALWAVGGNLPLDEVLSAAGPLLTGGDTTNVGAMLPKILPMLANMSAGGVVGVEVSAPVAAEQTPTMTPVSVPLDTPLRLRAEATIPDLPMLDGKYVDGVFVFAGASAYPMGYTPLGLSVGLAAKDGNGTRTRLVNDPTCDPKGAIPCNTSKIPFRLAARNHGLEQFKYTTMLIALNYASLTLSESAALSISGLVRLDSDIAFTKDTDPAYPITYAGRAFPKLTNTGVITYSKAARTLTVQADAEASTQIYRFALQNAARQSWNIWMAPVGTGQPQKQVVLPDPALLGGGLVDPVVPSSPQTGGAPKASSARMTGIITTAPLTSYQGLTGFGDLTLDALGDSLAAFTLVTVPLNP